MTEWQDASYNLYVPKAQYEAMKRRLTASNADLLQALKYLRGVADSDVRAVRLGGIEIADRAIAKAESRP